TATPPTHTLSLHDALPISAYQIEGSPLSDGAGMSNWHRFTHTPGLTVAGENGDVACDHYHRYPEDVEWMARLGLDSYRFSLAWRSEEHTSELQSQSNLVCR